MASKMEHVNVHDFDFVDELPTESNVSFLVTPRKRWLKVLKSHLLLSSHFFLLLVTF